MKFSARKILVIAAIAAMAIYGFAFNTTQDAIKMEYKVTSETLTYKFVTSSTQEMEVQGQVMTGEGTAEGEFTYSLKNIDGKLEHNLTATEMEVSVSSSAAEIPIPDTDPLIDVTLKILTGLRGENPDPQNLDDVALEEEPSPTALTFAAVIFELAPNAVSVGDTWKSTVNLDTGVNDNTMNTETETTYTFEGLEDKDGYNCMKITGVSIEKVNGEFNQGGMDIAMESEGEGNYTIYFAHKEGMLVEIVGESDSEMTMDLTAMGMSFPGSSTSMAKISLKK